MKISDKRFKMLLASAGLTSSMILTGCSGSGVSDKNKDCKKDKENCDNTRSHGSYVPVTHGSVKGSNGIGEVTEGGVGG